MINNKFDKLPKLIIFDWDNTIIENWEIMHKALNYTLELLGQETWSLEKVKANSIYARKDYFPKIFGPEQAVKASKLYLRKYDELRTNNLSYIKDAEKLLEFLFEKREKKLLKLAVLSNKLGNFLREELESLNISKNFDAIIGSGDYSEDKPSIIGVTNIKKLLNIKEDEITWFVGDTITDMECAIKSNSVAIFFSETMPQKEYFLSYQPHFYFTNYQDFYDLIKDL